MIDTTTVKPPANGRKLWRVKKTTNSSQPEANTIQCLQNSLKITAAGNQYSAKKSHLKRPKNKPGMPKDFVFVDLSPVKDNDADESDNSASLPPSPTVSDNSDSNESMMTNDTSITDISLDSMLNDHSLFNEDISDSVYILDADASFDFGLGLMNFDEKMLLNQNVYESSMHKQQMLTKPEPIAQTLMQTPQQQSKPQFETPVNQILKTPEIIHKRSKSVDSIKKKGLQFKTYTPKSKTQKVKKPQLKHRHTISEPISKKGLDDFMNLNNQIKISLQNGNEATLQEPLKSEHFCGVDQFLFQKQDEFDFNSFVSF